MLNFALPSALLLAATVRAQFTTVDLFMYDYYQPSLLVASVVAADATATTYSLDCPSSTSTSSCSYYDDDCYSDDYDYDYCPSSAMVTAAPGWYEGSYDDTYYETAESFHCDIAGSTSAVCTYEYSSSDGQDSYTTTLDDYDITYYPVIVTAGGDLIGATGAGSLTVETILSTHSRSAGASTATATGFATGSASGSSSFSSGATRTVGGSSTASTPSGTAGSSANGTSSSAPAQQTTNAGASIVPFGASIAGVVAIAFAALAL